MDRVVREIEAGGLEPPTVDELIDGLGVDDRLLHQLLDLLIEGDRLVRIDPEIHLPPDRARELIERGRSVLERGTPAGASAFKEELMVTRKYLIPYLQYLDRRDVTRRTSEGRVPGGGRAGADG